MTDDPDLLRRYLDERSEAAFAALVERHVGLVYAAALRQLGGSAHRAEEVTQLVFIDLARKARSLAGRAELVGWLYTSTHYAAAKLKRTEQRRQQREQEAQAMNEIMSDDQAPADWARIAPVLDEAMQGLAEADREAILLRFFQGRRFAEIGRHLQVSEDGARMRVDRALEKLRGRLARREITSTAAALATLLGSQPAVALPAGLAAGVTGAAVAASGGAAMFFLMNTKTVLATAVAIVASGLAIYQILELKAARIELAALAQERAALAAQVKQGPPRDAAAPMEPTVETTTVSAKKATRPAVVSSSPLPSTPPSEVSTIASYSFQMVGKTESRQRVEESIDSTYAALYRQLKWTPEERARFRALMLQQQANLEPTYRAAIKAARAANPQIDGASVDEIIDVSYDQMRKEQAAEVRRAFGDAAGEAMDRFHATESMRSVTNQLTTALFNSDAPIVAEQVDRLVDILAQNARGPSGTAELAALNVENAIAQAQSLLTPAQAEELRKIATRSVERKRSEQANKATRNVVPTPAKP